MFFSSVSPPRPLASLYTRSSGLVFGDVFGRCRSIEYEGADLAGPLASDEWNHIAIVFNGRETAGIPAQVGLSLNGQHRIDYVNWPQWCPQGSIGSNSLIEAVYFSHEVLVSGVEFHTRALSTRELQLHSFVYLMDVRGGILSE